MEKEEIKSGYDESESTKSREKKVYWPRVIEYKQPEAKDERGEVMAKIKNFLLGIKPREKLQMLEQVYLNNFIYAKTKEQMELLFNILKAMDAVDRAYFVLREYRNMAYFDNALPIGFDQTISQPSTVARMLLLLFDGIWERRKEKVKFKVFEVGTGSGWNAALIAYLLSFYFKSYEVHSVDRIEGLVKFAKQNLAKLLAMQNQKEIKIIKNKIKIAFDDAFEYAKGKKFDYIIFTAGIPNKIIEEKVKAMARENLRKDGILICPETYGEIFIYKKAKHGHSLKLEKTSEAFAFVPLLEGKIYE
ncbi:MAG: hypothetical protein QXE64_00705 [Candidatus Pacearchaeota archaeon]